MKVKLLRPDSIAPRHAHETDGGYDLAILEDLIIPVGPADMVSSPSGLAMALPSGYLGKLRPRSSTGRQNLVVQGEIDAEYRGEILFGFWNQGPRPIYLKAGSYPLQMTVVKVDTSPVEVVDELDQTERGAGAFGSTDVGPTKRIVGRRAVPRINRDTTQAVDRDSTDKKLVTMNDIRYPSLGLYIEMAMERNKKSYRGLTQQQVDDLNRQVILNGKVYASPEEESNGPQMQEFIHFMSKIEDMPWFQHNPVTVNNLIKAMRNYHWLKGWWSYKQDAMPNMVSADSSFVTELYEGD